MILMTPDVSYSVVIDGNLVVAKTLCQIDNMPLPESVMVP